MPTRREDAAVSLKVLIVDDHQAFRSFARELLESEGFEIIGEAADGATAFESAAALRPDLILLDVQLPDISGFEVIERLQTAGVRIPVVLTSSRDASSYGDQIALSAAIGFVPKAELSGQALMVLLKEAS
jgi:DNA-binding NarL/FixJ family response regulator